MSLNLSSSSLEWLKALVSCLDLCVLFNIVRALRLWMAQAEMSFSAPPGLTSVLGRTTVLRTISSPGTVLSSKSGGVQAVLHRAGTARIARLSAAAQMLSLALLHGNECAELPTVPLRQLGLREKPKPFPRAVICQACVTVWHVKWPS